MEASKFNFYSIGLVAKNKPLSSKIIEVTPTEDLPMLNGEITDNAKNTTATSTDASGATYSSKVTTTSTLKATWLPINNSNRLTPPDVRRGETIVIYRFGDTDQYFWNTLKDDSNLRRLETVIYGFSGNPTEGAPVDAENMYFLEVSTHKKIMHLHTSKKNGEPFTYDIQINAGEGYIQIQDDGDNFILFNSTERRIVASNADGSYLSIDKKNVSIKAPDTYTVDAKTIVHNGKDITNNGSSSFTVNSPDTDIN